MEDGPGRRDEAAEKVSGGAVEMSALKCSIIVIAGVIPGQPDSGLTRKWHFTQENLNSLPDYIDRSGAALNYAMSLMNPSQNNWVRMEWIWY